MFVDVLEPLEKEVALVYTVFPQETEKQKTKKKQKQTNKKQKKKTQTSPTHQNFNTLYKSYACFQIVLDKIVNIKSRIAYQL